MTRRMNGKWVLAAIALLAGGVIAYVLYDSGRLPGIGAGSARGVAPGSEDLVWSPAHADPAKLSEAQERARLERRLRQHKPWGIKPDEDDDSGLTEEEQERRKAEWKARRQKFKDLPKEQRQAIRQRCRTEVRNDPDFDCASLWLNPDGTIKQGS